MSVIGEFTIPAAAFALDHALATQPEMRLEADRLVSHGPKEVFPFLWASGSDFESFTDTLEADPSVRTVSIADQMAEETLYRLEWRSDFLDLVHEMVDHHAAFVAAVAQAGQWHLKLRFASEEMVSEFQAHFRETGHPFEVERLTHADEPRQREFGLTKAQYDALEAAVRGGFFRVPRETSVEELGETLGISSNAVSQRLRRGCETMLQTGLFIAEDEIDSPE